MAGKKMSDGGVRSRPRKTPHRFCHGIQRNICLAWKRKNRKFVIGFGYMLKYALVQSSQAAMLSISDAGVKIVNIFCNQQLFRNLRSTPQ